MILKVWKVSRKQLPFIYDGRSKKLVLGGDSRNNNGIYTSPQNPKANRQAEVLLTSPVLYALEKSHHPCFLASPETYLFVGFRSNEIGNRECHSQGD